MIGEEVEREKEMELNVTVGRVFDSPHCGPLLITNRPMGEGVSINALTVFVGLTLDDFGSMTNCFVLSSKAVDAVSASECVPVSSVIFAVDPLCVKAVWICMQGTSSHPQLLVSTPSFFSFVRPATYTAEDIADGGKIKR